MGANLGYLTKLFLDWTGPKGEVYAVEPVEEMRNVLKKNIGNRRNLHIMPFALGGENKNITMANNTRRDKGFIASGSNFVLDSESTEVIDSFDSMMRKGSELFGTLTRLDFIKCDVEGYETVIIPEMKQLIIQHQPIMLIETRNEKREFLVPFLADLGFEGYVLENGKLYPASLIEEKIEDDILFVPKDKLGIVKPFIA
jgi:FkbM family methyltransferase